MDFDSDISDMTVYKTGWFRVIKQEIEGRKTPKYFILSEGGDIILGEISWYGRWRKFVFSPSSYTVWDVQCLNELASILENINIEYKQKKEGSEDVNS